MLTNNCMMIDFSFILFLKTHRCFMFSQEKILHSHLYSETFLRRGNNRNSSFGGLNPFIFPFFRQNHQYLPCIFLTVISFRQDLYSFFFSSRFFVLSFTFVTVSKWICGFCLFQIFVLRWKVFLTAQEL